MRHIVKILSIMLVTAALLVSFAGCGGGQSQTILPTPEAPVAPEKPAASETPTEQEKLVIPEPAEPTLAATVFGQSFKIGIDADGALREDYSVATPDSSVHLTIQAGTMMQDADGKPIPELTIAIREDPGQPEPDARVIGTAVSFYPDMTYVSKSIIYDFDYAAFSSDIATVTNADVYLARFVDSRGSWARIYSCERDTANQIVRASIDSFTIDYTVGLIAAPPKEVIRAEGPPANGIDIVIEGAMEYTSDAPGTLQVKTLSDAYVLCWMVNPGTGSRSSRPEDHFRQADADGRITWDFTISRHVSRGEGHFEFYVTTNPDEAFLEVFQANRLDTVFPDRAEEILRFRQGLVEQMVLDDQTTLKMYPYVVAVGREQINSPWAKTDEPEPAPAPPPDPSGPGIALEISYITPQIEATKEVTISVKTVPGATVYLQPINPNTGTRSSWPKIGDGGKKKTADAEGLANWTWTLFRAVNKGEGTLEFLVTTSTDGDYLALWKQDMSPAVMLKHAERDDTFFIQLPWTVVRGS